MSRSVPEVLVVIPAFNEEERLPGVLRQLAELGHASKVVVVDDASQDDTAAVARELGAVVLTHRTNLGYGGALQTGYKHALRSGAKYIVQLDSDGQHSPALMQTLLRPLMDEEADIVIGSRFLKPTGYEMGVLRTYGRKVINGLGKLAQIEITDPTSGLQAMNRRALEVYARDFFPMDYPDLDVLIVASRRGLRIREVTAEMNASLRPSKLHGGLRSFWYAYKMSLSVFAATGNRL